MSVVDEGQARPTQRSHTMPASAMASLSFVAEPRAYFTFRRWIDRVIALILLIPGMFIMGCLVVLVRLTSPGPGIFRQKRVGQGGRTFLMYKIRTMRSDAEAGTGPVWTRPSDPRVTAIGRILRKLHLDELPQLINVLKGEMLLLGPRPERPEFVAVLSEQIPGYLQRLSVPPGVTGLAQINLPPDTDLDSVRRKLVLDLEYIEEAGPVLDLRMFLCTMVRLVGLPGDALMRLFRLRRHVTLSPRDPHLFHPTQWNTPHAQVASCAVGPGHLGALWHDSHKIVVTGSEQFPLADNPTICRKPR